MCCVRGTHVVGLKALKVSGIDEFCRIDNHFPLKLPTKSDFLWKMVASWVDAKL